MAAPKKDVDKQPEKQPADEGKTPADVNLEVKTHTEIEGEGITGFSVSAGAADDYGKHKTSTVLHYQFGRPVSLIDLVVPHAEASDVVSELALDKLREHRARSAAEVAQANTPAAQAPQQQAPQPPPFTPQPAPPFTQPAPPAPMPQASPQWPQSPPQQFPPQQAPQPAPQPQVNAQAIPWATGAKQDGSTLRFIPSNVIPTEQFQALIAQAIQQQGDDPNQFVIYDNRVGQYALEAGNPGWSVAAVKPAHGTPVHQALDKKSAYYVDFNDDGSVGVRPSREYEGWRNTPTIPGNAPF